MGEACPKPSVPGTVDHAIQFITVIGQPTPEEPYEPTLHRVIAKSLHIYRSRKRDKAVVITLFGESRRPVASFSCERVITCCSSARYYELSVAWIATPEECITYCPDFPCYFETFRRYRLHKPVSVGLSVPIVSCFASSSVS